MSKIGDKYVLWRTHYSLEAYTDQFGKKHPGYIVDDEYHVTVTETHNRSKCMWTDKSDYPGTKAVTEDGIVFTQHWKNFPSDSNNPSYYWDAVQDVDGIIWQPTDALQAYNKQYGVPFVFMGKKARPHHEELTYCLEHDQMFFYQQGGRCFQCVLARVKAEKEQSVPKYALDTNGSRSIRPKRGQTHDRSGKAGSEY